MYKVTYTIDIDATSPLEAAKKAHEIIKKQVGPVFDITNCQNGDRYNVDLDDIIGETVTQLPPVKPVLVCTCGDPGNWELSKWGS